MNNLHKVQLNLMEAAETVLQRTKDGNYIVIKSRKGDLIVGGRCSEMFIEKYANTNENVYIDLS